MIGLCFIIHAYAASIARQFDIIALLPCLLCLTALGLGRLFSDCVLLWMSYAVVLNQKFALLP